MRDHTTTDLSWDEFDERRDPRPAATAFDAVVDRALSRRGFLGGVLAFAWWQFRDLARERKKRESAKPPEADDPR